MAQIDDRGHNTWQVRVFLGRDSNGKRKFHTRTVKGTKKDAVNYAAKVQHEFATGKLLEPNLDTLDAFLDHWLSTIQHGKGANTIDSYTKILKRYVRPKLGAQRLNKLTVESIQAVYNEMLERGLSDRTVSYTHTLLNAALAQAVKWKKLHENPAADTLRPPKTTTKMKAFDHDEADQFIKACALDQWGILFTFSLMTGMRPGEVLGLRWRDLDFAKNRVIVQQTLIKAGVTPVFEEPKTTGSRRTIPFPKELTQDLREHKRHQAEERLALGSAYENFDLVFACGNGRPLSERNLVLRHFKPLLKRAGLSQNFRFYDLRHTCATLLLSVGENPKVVSERLGHASIKITLDTYSHVLPTMQQSASDHLAALFYKPKGQGGAC